MPTSIETKISKYYEHDCLTNLLDEVDKFTPNKRHWYSGHYHDDKDVDDMHTVLYNTVVEVR